jgi:uncharacterized protein YdhG (YjbR/CyaY superfamily)
VRARIRAHQSGALLRNSPGHPRGISASLPEESRARAGELTGLIRRCVPGAREKIAWSMPFFERDGRNVSFAACKNHISLYLDAETIEGVRAMLDGYAIKKNAVYLPYKKELPETAVEDALKRIFGKTGL